MTIKILSIEKETERAIAIYNHDGSQKAKILTF